MSKRLTLGLSTFFTWYQELNLRNFGSKRFFLGIHFQSSDMCCLQVFQWKQYFGRPNGVRSSSQRQVKVDLTMPSCGFKLSKRELGHNDLGVGGNRWDTQIGKVSESDLWRHILFHSVSFSFSRTCLMTPGPGVPYLASKQEKWTMDFFVARGCGYNCYPARHTTRIPSWIPLSIAPPWGVTFRTERLASAMWSNPKLVEVKSTDLLLWLEVEAIQI